MAEGTSEVVTEAQNPPPKKKSLFSKKILAQATEVEEGVDFFSRSHEIFPQRLAEEERRRQKKLVKLERKRTSSSVEEKEPSPYEEKRRRVSNQGLYSSDEEPAQASRTRRQSTNSTPGSRKSRSASAQKTQASATSLSGRYSRDLQEEKKTAPKNYISLTESEDDEPKPVKAQPINLDDDDDDIYCVPQPKHRKPVVPDPELSDEEFPELVQAARERERQKTLQRQKATKYFAEQDHASNGLDDDDIFDTEGSAATADPILEVLISSEIDGTKPLLVKRKLTQKLKEVRLAWCDKQSSEGQPMAQHVKDSIILTWKGKRIYDVQSCQTFNLSFDSTGKAEGDGVDRNGRIHLEAWTQDLYNTYQKTQATKSQREQNGGEPEEEVVDEVEVKKIKLFLRSKDYGEVKRSVKPSTMVQKLIDAFRQEKKIPDDKEISVHVDGDKLDPEDKIEDTELEDRDAVEVHIR